MTTTERPGAATTTDCIDVDSIALTIDQALTRRRVLPPYQELVDLERLLRGHLQLLMPIVQKDTDALDRGTPEWYQQQTCLDHTRQALAQGLGEGLQSAASHVEDLGRMCRILLNYQQEDTR
ncbi:DUF6415 family natural product biosynthesis protein [Streptomyces sp. 7N604]|uniref:DUF6415 family natural product biosynthesis protein n=1 Tax=Streptomyces sp. 7N604 TaxID=3457415 RepID=UPI003FD57265